MGLYLKGQRYQFNTRAIFSITPTTCTFSFSSPSGSSHCSSLLRQHQSSENLSTLASSRPDPRLPTLSWSEHLKHTACGSPSTAIGMIWALSYVLVYQLMPRVLATASQLTRSVSSPVTDHAPSSVTMATVALFLAKLEMATIR